ncbi:MAG: HAD hydrolase family protein [Promethearchaeia archaeon]
MIAKKVCCWDLEGPLSVTDFAAELGKRLRDAPELDLADYDMGEFFFMISNYDDYLIDNPGIKEKLNIPEYQPGDTLRLLAPLYVAAFSEDQLFDLAQNHLGILPGSQELMALLHKEWEIFVISTSYTQFAYTVTEKLDIPRDHVYCTELPIEKLKSEVSNINESVKVLIHQIFQKYLDSGKNLNRVLADLNEYFWKSTANEYVKIMNHVAVRGGERKEKAVEDIVERTDVPISEMIALGDSITDINMLKRVSKEGGIAVSFNGNRYSLRRANIAVTTPNNLGALPIFEHHANLSEFLEVWELSYSDFSNNPKEIPNGLVSPVCRNHFIYYDFVPDIRSLKSKEESELQEIIEKQEEMRKRVRGWAGELG